MSRTEANDRLAELRSMPYRDYLLSPEWRERRKQALDWARNACQLCNSPQEPLNVHHRTYDRLGAELPADLVVLCKACHEKYHVGDPGIHEYLRSLTKAYLRLSRRIREIEKATGKKANV